MPDLYVQSCIILKCKSSVWFLLGYFGSFQRGSSNGSIISKGKIRKLILFGFIQSQRNDILANHGARIIF